MALGVSVILAADIVKSALLGALESSDAGKLVYSGIFDQLNVNLNASGIAISLAAGFIVFNAFGISIARRRRKLATLRSIGMTRSQVLRLTLVEAIFTGATGVVLGLLAGPILGRLTIEALKGVTDEGVLLFSPGPPSATIVVLAILLGLLISLLAALLPAIQATQVSPLAARRPMESEVPGSARSWTGWAALAGMVLILIYLRAMPPGKELDPPWDVRAALFFVLLWLTLVLLVTAAAAGVVGSMARGPLGRVAGVSGVLIADNLRRGRRRVWLTVLSLAFALALVVGLAGFTRFTFEFLMRPIIDRASGLGAWVATGFDVMAGMGSFQGADDITLSSQDLEAVRAAVGDRAALNEIRYAAAPELSFFGSSFFSFLLTPEQTKQGADWLFEFEQGDWNSARRIMEQGCGVLVVPAVASELDADLGDTVLVSGSGEPVECMLAGIGSSFVTASVIGSTDPDAFEATDPLLVMITPLPGADRIALEADLARLSSGLTITVIDDVTGAINGLVEQIPVVLNGMAVLAVLAASLGVVNTLTASVVERRGELGLFRAVGATRRQLRTVVTGEAALLAGLGAAIGIAAGLGIAIILPTVYGGSSWGISDLDHWAAATDAVNHALVNAIVGWVMAVLIGVIAGILIAQGVLRHRRLVDELQAEGH